MDAGDKIALGAMIVSIIAMTIAIWQASEARGARKVAREQADIAKKALEQATKQSAAAERSATAADLSAGAADRSAGAAEEQVVEARKAVRAAEESAAEARKANEFAREKDTREKTERDETAVAEASTVRGALTNMGGVALTVTNDGTKPVYDLELESVEAAENPTFAWRFRPTVGTQRAVRETVTAGGSHTYYIDFTDEDGTAHRAPGQEYRFTISFTDASGQRWRRVNSGPPVRVSADETSEATPRDAVTPVAASSSEEGLRLLVLRTLRERLQANRPINLKTLPDELGLEDHHVQQALRSLHEDDMIDALTGDDRVLSVRRLTRRGSLELLHNRR